MKKSLFPIFAVGVAGLCLAALSPDAPEGTSVNVTQHHNNPSRDGLFVDPAFTTAAATNLTRDLGFDGTISGQVYAQPLYIEDGPGGVAMVIAVTESNNVYALNATTGAIVWQRNVGTPSGAMGNITPNVGITGTPVVDLASRSLFLNAVVSGPNNLIFSLNVDTGATNPGWPVDVNARIAGFNSQRQSQRAALGIMGSIVYVAYGGYFGDAAPYFGRVVGVQMNNPASLLHWATTAPKSGVWGPGGIANDGTNLFVTTGNATFGSAWGAQESIVRLQTGPTFTGATTDFWTPTNWSTLDQFDTDLGGSGPILVDVPGATPSALVVALGKDGNAYLVNRNNLGGIIAPLASGTVGTGSNIQAAATYRTATGTYVVFRPTSNTLTAFRITATNPPTIATGWTISSTGRSSPFVTSTDGTNNMIVWAFGTGAANSQVLRGYNGDTGAVVYNGGGTNELMAGTRSFNTGIAARGRIYIAADNRVYAFTVPTGGATPTPTPPATPTPTPTPPATPTPPISPTPSLTPSFGSPTPTPPTTPTPSATPTATATPSATPPCARFIITINGAQEVPPNGSAATGTATIDVNTVTNQLSYNITFSGLGSTETMAHIHGFAPPGMNAGIIHTLPNGSPKVGVFNYSQADEANILNGLSYVNIHSVNFPNGEIRGQISGPTTTCPTPTPTPTTTPSPSFPPPLTPTPTPVACSFSNSGAITIPDSGPAAPYPSNMLVAGQTGTMTKVTVSLNNLTHTFPADLDVLLVSPGGQNAIIMSDVGGGDDVTNITLTLDDAAANAMPAALLTSGTFRPTNAGVGDTWPAPAPAPAGGSPLSVFNGGNPNGTWALYLVDDAAQNLGTLSSGWTLNISTTTGPCALPTPSPTPTVTPSPTPTATATATVTPPATPTIPPSATPTATPTIPPTATPTATPSLTPAVTATPTATPAQAVNLSTRMFVQAGDNAGIAGFIISGSAPKHVLVRVIGPSLTQFGIPNPLADPTVELHGPKGFTTVNNDNWQDDPVQAALIQATGLAPTNNLESAIDATLNPGAYTAVARGKNNGTGVGVIEVFDLSQAVLAKLANISTRAFVNTGNDIVIAGFILGGNSGEDRIVVRGIGPSLAAFGVPNALANPTLELRDTNGALLLANNDWQDDPAQAAELTAAGLAPTDPLESGIAIALPPGLYTALLAGFNNATGVGVVEVYDRGAP